MITPIRLPDPEPPEAVLLRRAERRTKRRVLAALKGRVDEVLDHPNLDVVEGWISFEMDEAEEPRTARVLRFNLRVRSAIGKPRSHVA